ncbi:MAG: hypothetical protein V3T99_05475, partial [Nitrososphaerales archaeon]
SLGSISGMKSSNFASIIFSSALAVSMKPEPDHHFLCRDQYILPLPSQANSINSNRLEIHIEYP